MGLGAVVSGKASFGDYAGIDSVRNRNSRRVMKARQNVLQHLNTIVIANPSLSQVHSFKVESRE